MTNQDIKLIAEFMELPLTYELFQNFLESKEIEGTEAESLLETLKYESD